jgi:hypothetical protein
MLDRIIVINITLLNNMMQAKSTKTKNNKIITTIFFFLSEIYLHSYDQTLIKIISAVTIQLLTNTIICYAVNFLKIHHSSSPF